MLREDELPYVVSVYMGFACLFIFVFLFVGWFVGLLVSRNKNF